MIKRIIPGVLVAAMAITAPALAFHDHPAVSCAANHAQARAALRRAEHQGPAAIDALAKLAASCGSGQAHIASPPALPDELLREMGTNTELAKAILGNLSSVAGPPSRVPAASNVIEDQTDAANPFGPRPTGPPAKLTRARAHAASCWGYLANPTRIYDGGIHIGTITKTLGGWCGDSIAIYSIWNWGHEVPWVNPNYPALCWMKYAVGHGPDSPWVWDNGAYHTAWAHGYIIDNIGTNSGQYGCTYPYSRNWWSIIRVSRTGYHDGYNDYGFHT